MKSLNKFLSFVAVFLLLFYQISIPLTIYAQESSPSASEEQTIEPSPSPSETPALSVEPSPAPTPNLDESLTTSPATDSTIIDTSTTENQSSATLAPPVWQTTDGSATTINNVVLNQIYIAPQNDKVTVTFTKLPENPGTLTIKQIILSQEDKEDLGAVSDVAYDITSTMENGTFEYTLTLPTPKTENVEVKASEDGENFVNLGGVTAQEDTLTITGLNHFTVFVVASPSSGTDASDVGTVTWTNPGNVLSSDNFYATAAVDGTTTHYLKATNFGLSIPSTATIKGIVVSIERRSNSNNNGGSNDAAVRLIKGGSVGTTDKSTATIYPAGATSAADAYEDHGGATDLWGESWTPADINSSTFGVAFAATKASNAGPAHTINVDHVKVTVYYNTPPVATDDSALTNEDTPVDINTATLLANDTDVDVPPDTLSVTAVGNAVNGTVSLSGSTVTFTPSANYNGSGASFEYTLSDGELTDTGLVTVTVTSVNDPPTMSVIFPNGGDVFAGGSIRAVSWSASDVDTGQTLTISLEYTTDGVSYTTIATGENNDGSYSWFVPSIDSSTVKVRATVSDGITSASDLSDANFTIDSTAPTGTITINDGAEYTNSTSAQLSFTVSETISQMELRNGTVGSFQSPIAYENPHDYTLPSGDGTKTVSVRFTDNATNKSSGIISDSIILDTTSPSDPTASSTSHTVSVPSSNQTIDMAIDGASDALSGVDGFAYEFNNDAGWICDESKDVEEDTTLISQTLFEGEWYFHLCTVDNAGNWTSTVDIGPFIIDATAPTINSLTIDPFNFDYYYISNTVTVSAEVTDDISDVSSVQFTMFDTFGTEESCDGVQSEEDPSYWSCQIDTTVLDDSNNEEYDLSAAASDSAGNTSDEALYSNFDYYFDIDNTTPVTSDSGTDADWHNSDVTVNFNCEDSASGCAETYFTTDGSDPDTDSNTGTSVTLDSDGEYTVKYFSKDNAGNSETVKTAANQVKIDKTNPSDPTTVTSSSHTTSTWSNDPTVDVSWSGADDNLSEVAGYSYEWDTNTSTVPNQDPEGLATSTTSPSLPDGNSNYFHLSTVDNAGNWTSTVDMGPFFIETIAPSTPVATPAGGDYTADQAVSLSSSDSGGSGLGNIYYTTDGTTPSNTNGTLYTGASITVNQSLTLKAAAYDSAGNISSIMTEVYGIAPVISSETTSSVASTSITVTWTTDDPATSRVIYDTVSHPVLGAAPNYGYANSTVEDATKVTSHSVGISGLSASTTYYYRTVSHGSPETVGSEKSTTTAAVAAASTSTSGGGGGGGGGASAPTCNDPAAGGVPTLLSATVSGSNQVILTWSKAPDPVTNYVVTYGLTAGAQQYGNPNVGGKDTTSYTISSLSGGTTYYFKVRAGNGCNAGGYSNELSATPGGGIISGPAAGFAPGVLGVSTENEEINNEQAGEVKGEAATSNQTSQPAVAPSLNPIQAIFQFVGSFFGWLGSLFNK